MARGLGTAIGVSVTAIAFAAGRGLITVALLMIAVSIGAGIIAVGWSVPRSARISRPEPRSLSPPAGGYQRAGVLTDPPGAPRPLEQHEVGERLSDGRAAHEALDLGPVARPAQQQRHVPAGGARATR